MGPFEEMWHPAATRYRTEIRVQEERMTPRPSADDTDERAQDSLGPQT